MGLALIGGAALAAHTGIPGWSPGGLRPAPLPLAATALSIQPAPGPAPLAAPALLGAALTMQGDAARRPAPARRAALGTAAAAAFALARTDARAEAGTPPQAAPLRLAAAAPGRPESLALMAAPARTPAPASGAAARGGERAAALVLAPRGAAPAAQAPDRPQAAAAPAPLRVVIHHLRAEEGRAAALARRLSGAAPGGVRLVAVGATPGRADIRVFHAADRAGAARIAALLPAARGPRDFTAFRPAPRPGLVEIWLAPAPDPRLSRP
ncbi:hypothetical protein ACQ5SO_09535 [Rhodovulum sp. DZ06]|uniref:hypothetical protein n=1 Tax=Rhodovulum sp. DZ06 TaxID=3425126 RepID=UPI003D359327